MSHFKFLTSGESHGKSLTAIIEGLPAGFEISESFINEELKRRQQGYGRSSRQLLENDTVEITSGLSHNKTTGAPICLVVQNKDYSEKPPFSKYRPGHADFAGSKKYNLDDLRDVLERASARKTAIEVAVGAVAKQILEVFEIKFYSNILQIGTATEAFNDEIDSARKQGDSLGGKFEVISKNIPVGLGSYVHWDRALDGKIAQAVMSIGGIKAVEIGENPLGKTGFEYHDELFFDNGKIYRKTNNAGGVEGGMSNGEDLIVRAVMKPIPTMVKPLKTVDSKTYEQCEAYFERSDVCAVESCAVVAENRIACVIADEFLQKFGGDSLKEIMKKV